MSYNWKQLAQLTIRDLQAYPVWEFVPDIEGAPVTAVRAVEELPATDLSRRLIGTKLKLNCGASHWAILGNISLENARSTQHFLCARINRDDRWFDLARYHDVDFDRRGPSALADFLKLAVSDIFPMEYDISGIVLSDPTVTRGIISREPEERLSESELIAMALEG